MLRSCSESSRSYLTQARKIDTLLENLQAGDLLLVSELSRLGRSVGQIMQIVGTLIKKRQLKNIYCQKVYDIFAKSL
ncbi:MAG: recombinase family protein [Deltaproteobacteria bacterium]|nr:recombinase family protein [Deltaproteobacteria bacterium]